MYTNRWVHGVWNICFLRNLHILCIIVCRTLWGVSFPASLFFVSSRLSITFPSFPLLLPFFQITWILLILGHIATSYSALSACRIKRRQSAPSGRLRMVPSATSCSQNECKDCWCNNSPVVCLKKLTSLLSKTNTLTLLPTDDGLLNRSDHLP